MIRISAYMMIFIGISGAGFEYAKRLGNRRLWYDQLIEFLTLLEQEIHYGHYELLESLKTMLPHLTGFFYTFAYSLTVDMSAHSGQALSEIWEQAMEGSKASLYEYGCGDEEMDMLRRVAVSLGSCCTGQQDDRLLGAIRLAEDRKEEISENLTNRQKAVRLLGICLGAFVVVALI